jgi:phospholipid/cholesterol/gamma-HCH transport system permease protein
VELRVSEDLTRETVPRIYRELLKKLRSSKDTSVVLHLDQEVTLDSAGVATLSHLVKDGHRVGKDVRLGEVGPSARAMLSIFGPAPKQAPIVTKKLGFFESLGDAAAGAADHFASFFVLTSDTVAFSLRGLTGRTVPWRTFVEQCVRIGSQSLPIIALISFLVGLTTALQAAYQLKQFGANIYIANMVGVAMLAEMGPLMTAILMAGRSGSSIAAEISTMVISEEVDALKTMGINPVRYIVIPKIYALVFTQPLLTAMASAVGIFGGLLVGTLYLDISVPAFWTQLIGAVTLKDLLQGELKSVVFALIIGLVSAHVGFRAKGGATGVGRSTTASVVASIFLVIVADAIFSLIFYFGD